MSLEPRWVPAVVAVIAALLCAACGTDTTTEAGFESNALSCESDRDEILELLRSGLPTYDHEPAVDLAALVERSAAVVSGTIASIRRSVGEPDADLGDNGWTVVMVQSPEVLHAFAEVNGPFDQFSYSSGWPTGAGSDPLAAEVGVEGMTFVAFLDFWEPALGRFAADVQGLVVSCAGDIAPTAVIEPLPGNAAGVSVAQLGSMVMTTSKESLE